MNTNLINYLKDKIINDLKKFELVDECIFLEKKHNDLIDKTIIKFILLSSTLGAISLSVIIQKDIVDIKNKVRPENTENEELLEMFEYLESNYKKKVSEYELSSDFQKKTILKKVKMPKKNNLENSKKRL